MIVKTKLSISIRDKYTVIEIHDDDAVIMPVKLLIPNENFVQALGRLSSVDCKTEFNTLEYVGMKREHKTFEFEMPEHNWNNQKEIAIQTIRKVCPRGWEPYEHFGSQDSFFTKDGKDMAKTTIVRWVKK